MTDDGASFDLIVTPQKVEYDQVLTSLNRGGRFLTDVSPFSGPEETTVHDVRVLHSGVGPEATRSSLVSLLNQHRPERVLLTGFCGSLDHTLRTGAVLVARRVCSTPELDGSGHPSLTPDSFPETTLRNDGVHDGSILTLPSPAFRRKRKRELQEAWPDCRVVDTESSVAVQLLQEQDIPCSVARVVLDNVYDDLSSIRELLRNNPEPSPDDVMAYALAHPTSIVPLANMARKFLVASHRLKQFLSELFPGAKAGG